MGSRGIPHDKVNLRLILVSGKTKEFLFYPNDSVADVTDFVYRNWPREWSDENPPASNILRLIYQGRFLHGNVTLGALQLPQGKTTVMHLVPRENLPESNNQGQLKKDKSGESNCSNCCVIVWHLILHHLVFFYPNVEVEAWAVIRPPRGRFHQLGCSPWKGL